MIKEIKCLKRLACKAAITSLGINYENTMHYKNLPLGCCVKASVPQNEALLCTPAKNEVDFIQPHSFDQLRKVRK